MSHGEEIWKWNDAQKRLEEYRTITEHASRYSTGSQGRIALETLALEIRERSQ